MRIAIHTLGTRGDVQPYIALAVGLTAAGHDVEIAAPEQFEAMVTAAGIGFAPLPREFLDLIDSPEAKAAMSRSKGFGGGFKLLKQFRPIMVRLFDAEWQAARAFRPDVLVYHPKALAAPHIAEALGCVAILASPLPGFTPTSAFPTPLLSFASLGPLNRASHSLMIGASGVLFGRTMARWRVETLSLGRRARFHAWKGVPTLYAYSPTVLPVPPDWGADVLVTGCWFLDDRTGWEPSPQLAAFLAAGPPPVYVGFGSMPVIDPAEFTATLVAAVQGAGQRAILAAGWGRLGGEGLPPEIFAIDGAPHDRLFPLVSAVVHHGGAGTTHAGLRAGRPTVVCPFFGDQPFWGRRIEQLGAGPPPVPVTGMTPEKLGGAISEAVSNRNIEARAAELGTAIRAEDGVGEAVAFIGQVAGRHAA